MIATADAGDLGVAAIGAAALIAAAAIPAWLTTRKTKNAIGKPNGRGTVVQMLEQSLENQGGFKEEMTRMSVQLDSVAAKQEAHSLEDNRRFRIVFSHLGIPEHQPEDQ